MVPASTPTPGVQFSFSNLMLGLSQDRAGTTVLGMLENTLDRPITEVEIEVTLSDAGGAPLSRVVADPLLEHLEPGEASPFKAVFTEALSPAAIDARVISFQHSEHQRGAVQTSAVQSFPVGGGDWRLLTELQSETGEATVLHRLGFLALDQDRQPLALIDDVLHGRYLEFDGSLPAIAESSLAPDRLRWQVYVDARRSEPITAPPVRPLGELDLRFTAQGKAFVVGSLRNESALPYELCALVFVRNGDQLVGVLSLRPPLPLPGLASFAFASDDLIWLYELEDLDALTLAIFIDPVRSRPSTRSKLELELEVDALEVIGSSLFVRGAIHNPHAFPVDAPTLLIEVRELGGELITGDWVPVAAEIFEHDELQFVIDLPVPPEIVLAEAELDIRSLGLQP